MPYGRPWVDNKVLGLIGSTYDAMQRKTNETDNLNDQAEQTGQQIIATKTTTLETQRADTVINLVGTSIEKVNTFTYLECDDKRW